MLKNTKVLWTIITVQALAITYLSGIVKVDIELNLPLMDNSSYDKPLAN